MLCYLNLIYSLNPEQRMVFQSAMGFGTVFAIIVERTMVQIFSLDLGGCRAGRAQNFGRPFGRKN